MSDATTRVIVHVQPVPALSFFSCFACRKLIEISSQHLTRRHVPSREDRWRQSDFSSDLIKEMLGRLYWSKAGSLARYSRFFNLINCVHREVLAKRQRERERQKVTASRKGGWLLATLLMLVIGFFFAVVSVYFAFGVSRTVIFNVLCYTAIDPIR